MAQMTGVSTHDLQPGDFALMVAGSHPVGSRFLIEDVKDAPWITLVPATKSGARDHRRAGWSGCYSDARWDIIRRGCSIDLS